MTNQFDRRLRKLEASVRTAAGEGAAHIAFVRPGENADEKVAALGPVGCEDQLIVVQFVRPGEVRREDEVLQ